MAVMRITRKLAERPPAVPAGQRKIRVLDDEVRGFAMEVAAGGAVTFRLRYTDERGRQRDLPLGRNGDIDADQARKKAREMRAAVTLGQDPAGQRDARRAIPTFREFVRDTYIPYIADKLRAAADYGTMLKLRIVPAFGTKCLDEIGRRDVAAFRASLIAEGLSASRVNAHLALLRRIFAVAEQFEAFVGRNPAASPDMLRTEHRQRFLDEDELRRMMAAIDGEPDRAAASVLALLVLTGCRKAEILGARWEHIDVQRRFLTVPLSKSGRLRHVPLSDAAVVVLKAQPRVPDQPFVFPSVRRPGRPIEDVRSAWERVKATAGFEDGLRIHDLRHTHASLLLSKGCTLHEIGQILGHTQIETTKRYAHLKADRLLEAVNTVGRLAVSD